MIGVPPNANAIKVSIVPTGCCRKGFDSTYPQRLNGIITKDEFEESIKNINRAKSFRITLIICALISVLIIMGSIALFIVNSKTIDSSGKRGSTQLIGIGLGILAVGILFWPISFFVTRMLIPLMMRRSIAKESNKYSLRSPKPCSWRLNALRWWGGRSSHGRRSGLIYSILIDIGNSTVPQ
ncbi:unnamed protein product [Adineta steineri]|uniref:Uncharacterized protein n=1 Tax=Adineta steineri TaxID=433720 RepID=A0A816CUF8_9BILA|nr:unnamed protein product [Adineta steineri]CAF1626282.1 unnamed protein product [Adineta steineri]